MLNRYSELTMHNKVVCKITEQALPMYEQLGIMPWHHIVIDNNLAFIYLWDTRIIEKVMPATCLQQEDLTYAVIDNRMDLVVNDETPENVRKLCEENKKNMPILFVSEPLTEDERAFLDINHY